MHGDTLVYRADEIIWTRTGYIKTRTEPVPILKVRTGPEPEVSEPDRIRNRSKFSNLEPDLNLIFFIEPENLIFSNGTGN